jgi:hypothetical protein
VRTCLIFHSFVGIDHSIRSSWFHISSSIYHVMSDLHSYNKDLKFLLKSCFHGLFFFCAFYLNVKEKMDVGCFFMNDVARFLF